LTKLGWTLKARHPSQLHRIMKEEWKQVVGFSVYQVSSLGRVRRNLKILKPDTDHGYHKVALHVLGRRYKRFIHCLVIESFHRSKRQGEEVNHINGIRNDNRLDNLEYVSRIENVHHARDVLGEYIGERNSRAKLTEQKVLAAREIKRSYAITWAALGKRFDVCGQTIKSAVRGLTWRHVKE